MEVITTHLNADFDSMASMVAAKKLYPEAILAFSGSQEKNLRKFFVQSLMIYEFQRLKNIDLEKVTKLIVVDTRQASRIGNFSQCLDNPGIEIHLYDHHPDAPGDMKGDVEVVRPVGSTATVFVEIFQKIAGYIFFFDYYCLSIDSGVSEIFLKVYKMKFLIESKKRGPSRPLN